MRPALGCRAGFLFLSAAALACGRRAADVRHDAEPSRAPVVHPSDPSWARLGQGCSAAAPVRLAPERPLPTTGRFPTEDERDAALARQVPGGYGGLYVSYDPPPSPGARPLPGSRGIVVLLVDTAQRDAALRALAPAIQNGLPDVDILRARIQPARWSFAELYDWYAVVIAGAGRDGVTTIDIDERENRIVFGVVDAEARQRLEQRLARLDLPCFLVAIEVVGRVIRG